MFSAHVSLFVTPVQEVNSEQDTIDFMGEFGSPPDSIPCREMDVLSSCLFQGCKLNLKLVAIYSNCRPTVIYRPLLGPPPLGFAAQRSALPLSFATQLRRQTSLYSNRRLPLPHLPRTRQIRNHKVLYNAILPPSRIFGF